MSIKTYRNIKNSLEVARRQAGPSITSMIEEDLKTGLEQDFGPILTEEERGDIIVKEKERKEIQDAALTKSRMKILKVKERAKETQRIRDALNQGKIPEANVNTKENIRVRDPEKTEEASIENGFKKINIGY
jgi:ABC-type enterochelin transport system ATPase subunit